MRVSISYLSLKNHKEKKIVGRLEKIDLPGLSLFGLDAKLDTGAYTSSLHCHKVRRYQKEGTEWVRFFVLDPDHPEYEEREFHAPVYRIKDVKSSNGIVQSRVIIKQKTNFARSKGTIRLSLADRTEMKYPVLIGRKFLAGRYLVDVSKKFIQSS
jgi:hypothetical protein